MDCCQLNNIMGLAFNDLCDALPYTGVALLDTNLRYLYINATLADFNGQSVERHIGSSVREVLPELADLIEPKLDDVLSNGIRHENFIVEGKTPSEPTQNSRWLASYLPVFDDHRQSVIAVLVIAVNETLSHFHEGLLRKNEKRYRQVINSTADGLVSVDCDGRIMLFNTRAEQMFGYRSEEIIGQPIETLLLEETRERHLHHREKYLQSPRTQLMSTRPNLEAKRKDGTVFKVRIGLNHLDTLPDKQEVLATISDISEEFRINENLQRALAEKTALLNEVHHRVKNNLQVTSSLLRMQQLNAPAELKPYLEESRGRVSAMVLLHQLLYENKSYSRIELCEYLEKLCHLLSKSMLSQHCHIHFNIQNEGEKVILNLEKAMPCGLLVNEIISNSIKHAFPELYQNPNPPNKVDIIICNLGDAGFQLSVADNGVGLPDDVEPGNTGSLGFQLIPALCNQLNAGLAINNQDGTSIVMTVKD